MKRFLNDKHLTGLKEHRYSAVDNSPFGKYVMQPFWNRLVQVVPLWVAPNAITLAGLIMNVVTVWIFASFEYNHYPQWVFLLQSVALFSYQSLDAIDGKQARRTGTSGPLGELFDHGCDAYNTAYICLAANLTLGNGATWLTMTSCLFAMTAFYTAQWQTFVTGTLEFGMVDITEGQIFMIVMHFLTYCYGQAIWGTEISLLGLTVELRFLVASLAIFASLQNILRNFYTIFIQNEKPTIASTSVLSPSIPVGIVLFLAYYIYKAGYNTLFQMHSSLLILTIGTVYAKITCRLIIAHMSKTPLEYYDKTFMALALLALNCRFEIVNNTIALYCVFVYVTLNLAYYCTSVCQQLCDCFNVYTFKIKDQQQNKAG